MSKKVLFGAFDTLEMMLLLSPKKLVSSGIIRKKFHMIQPGTIYKKLEKLIEQGFIEKKAIKVTRAGDDQMEYKLTDEGLMFRSGLVNRGLVVLQEAINSMKQLKDTATQKLAMGDENEKITELIMEFSEECSGMVDNQTLQEQQRILQRLLQKF